MKKIVFFGSGYYTIPIVEKLKSQGLQLVVTTEPKGKFIEYLKKENIPYLYSKLKDRNDIEKIKELKPDVGILASYGAIIPNSIIDLFPLGILNIHPSLLPKYKGPSPVQFTILNGEEETGVSIIELDEKVDHGPIVSQKTVKLTGDETLQTLTELLFLNGSEMIEEVIHNFNDSQQIQSKPQRINSEVFTKKIKKIDGLIDPTILPEPDVLQRKIRAFYPWPGVYLSESLGGKSRILKLMPYDTVQVEGKKPMSYKDFINGYGKEAENILLRLKLME